MRFRCKVDDVIRIVYCSGKQVTERHKYSHGRIHGAHHPIDHSSSPNYRMGQCINDDILDIGILF